jgi:hypothetical protein
MELITISKSSLNKVKGSLMGLLSVIIVLAVYIVCSTQFINEDKYKRYAFDFVNQGKYKVSFTSVSVDMVNLPPDLILAPNSKAAYINRILLNLNGNRAVKVILHIGNDTFLGPAVIYINPFTKRVIGIEPMD